MSCNGDHLNSIKNKFCIFLLNRKNILIYHMIRNILINQYSIDNFDINIPHKNLISEYLDFMINKHIRYLKILKLNNLQDDFYKFHLKKLSLKHKKHKLIFPNDYILINNNLNFLEVSDIKFHNFHIKLIIHLKISR